MRNVLRQSNGRHVLHQLLLSWIQVGDTPEVSLGLDLLKGLDQRNEKWVVITNICIHGVGCYYVATVLTTTAVLLQCN